MWNRRKLLKTFETEQMAVDWAKENHFFKSARICYGGGNNRHRGNEMNFHQNTDKWGIFRCPKCKKQSSLFADSWFEQANIPAHKIFSIMYSFANNDTYHKCRKEALDLDDPEDKPLADSTIAAWYHYCREMIVDDFIQREQSRGQIGGQSKIIQIDESKFGKRKFQRGRRVEGHWVLGLIEDGSEDFRLIICPENVRDAATLIPIIKEHVAEGSIIHTDMWRAYSRLNEHGYTHKVVNHSDPENHFVAQDGTHTQRIESSWRPAKDWFRQRRLPGYRFADALVEYQWRRECRKTESDPFEQLISAIKSNYHFN